MFVACVVFYYNVRLNTLTCLRIKWHGAILVKLLKLKLSLKTCFKLKKNYLFEKHTNIIYIYIYIYIKSKHDLVFR